jgi:hypothetical protein
MANIPRTSVQLSNKFNRVSFYTAQHKQRKKGQLTHRAGHRMARRGTNRNDLCRLRVAELQHACQHCTDRHEVDQARLNIVMENHSPICRVVDSKFERQPALHVKRSRKQAPSQAAYKQPTMHQMRTAGNARPGKPQSAKASKTPRLERAPVLWHVGHLAGRCRRGHWLALAV